MKLMNDREAFTSTAQYVINSRHKENNRACTLFVLFVLAFQKLCNTKKCALEIRDIQCNIQNALTGILVHIKVYPLKPLHFTEILV